MTKLEPADGGDFSGPFLGSHAVSEGVLTANQLRSSYFRRLFQNVYVPARLSHTHELRCRAAAAVVSREAVLTGNSAAVIHGFPFARDSDLVEFVVPERSRFVAQRGMHIRRTTLPAIDAEPWEGIRIATPLRTAMDILTNTRLRRTLPRLVAHLDVLLRDGFVEHDLLSAYLKRRHDHGIVRARQALGLSDARAESIPESEVRVLLRLGGLNPVPQLEVYDDGRFLGRLDLAIEDCKLAIEYDGQWHLEGDQPRLDARRRGALEAAGWHFVVITKEHLYDDPKGMLETVRDATRRRIVVV